MILISDILSLSIQICIILYLIISSGIIDKNNKAVKYLFISLGLLSVLLGIIGALLPIIPTTPFLLVASYFFTRSSKRFNDMLYQNKYLGPYLQAISSGKGMPLVAKIYTIGLLWFFMLVSMFVTDLILIKIILFIIATGVTIYISSLKTV